MGRQRSSDGETLRVDAVVDVVVVAGSECSKDYLRRRSPFLPPLNVSHGASHDKWFPN